MRLRQISIRAFRNLRSAEFSPDSFCTLLYGMNGQGKTNLLEAVYLLGNARSFRPSRLSDLGMHGSEMSIITGKSLSHGVESTMEFRLEGIVRTVRIDGKPVSSASGLRGKLTSVVFSPDDLLMIKQGPELRRKYLDRLVHNWDAGYFRWWSSYQKALKHRNHLLKTGNTRDIGIWTESLAESAAEITARRASCIAALLPAFKGIYSRMAGSSEDVDIRYRSEGMECSSRETLKNSMLEMFAAKLGIDERMRTTTAGPHRDDAAFLINGRQIRIFGSQGQQKSFIMSLKLAELELLGEAQGEAPLFLLDDLTSELDSLRRDNLAAFLAGKNIQVIVTTTDKNAFKGNFPSLAVYSVSNGNLTYEGTKTT